jgi:tRNA A-37 threonylcarbamoyl transferase component Bud32
MAHLDDTIRQETPPASAAGSEAAVRRIGPYRLLGVAGRGGTATVYEAVDDRVGRVVALKLLAPAPHLRAEDWEALVGRMQREARAIARLSHPNVALVLDVGTAGDIPEQQSHYIVMELLRGETLRERMDRVGRLTPADAAGILEQAAAGLDAVGAAGIVHRDVKPSNLMLVAPDDTVKLMDFGVARLADDTTVTRTGMMVGSPAYMAPELIRGEQGTEASDRWALGVVLYEMLSGRQPFAGDHIPAVLYQILHAELPPIEGLPASAQAVITRALERDPARRFATAAQMARAFRDALAGRPAVVPVAAAAAPEAAPVPTGPWAPYGAASDAPPPVFTRPIAPSPAAVTLGEAPVRRNSASSPLLPAAAVLAMLGIGGAFLLNGRHQERSPAPLPDGPAAATTGTASSAVKDPPYTATSTTAAVVADTAAGSKTSGTTSSTKAAPRPPAASRVATAPPGPRRTAQATPAALPTPARAPLVVASTPSPPPNPVKVVEVAPTPGPTVAPAAAGPTPRPARRRARTQVAQAPPPVPVPTPTPEPSATPTPAATPEPEAAAAPPALLPSRPEPEPDNRPALLPERPKDNKDTDNTARSSSRAAGRDDRRTLAGIWRGVHSRQPALLTLDPPDESGHFRGTLSVRTPSGNVLLAVSGQLRDDGTLTFTEERVVGSHARYAWDLGENEASIDPTTGTIQGEGRDARGRRYNFSFRRR